MPKSTKEEKFRWIKPILDKEISIKDMAKVCPFSERSLKYWLAAFNKFGVNGLENKSRRPKTNPRETPVRIKERIIELRREKNECALKIHYNYVRIPLKKGELIEIDVKFVPDRIEGKRYYQFTAIDCASRWRYMQAYENADNASSIAFLKELMNIADFKIQAVKTDNGSCFTNRYTGYNKSTDPLNPRLHAFDILCNKLKIPHYLIDAGKPQQNSYVERSHRTDQQKFYDGLTFNSFEDLRFKLRLWNMYYNDIKHCGLNGKTPNQALRLF